MVKITIKNGRIVTPSGVIYGGVAIDGEKIVYVGSDHFLPKAERKNRF